MVTRPVITLGTIICNFSKVGAVQSLLKSAAVIGVEKFGMLLQGI